MAQSDQPILAISQAAMLAGMHPQTLRQYDRIGLVVPKRTRGRGRRYSLRDVERLREIQRLSQQEGINLAGIQRIMDLEETVERLERAVQTLNARAQGERVFATRPSGDVVVIPSRRRVRRELERDEAQTRALVLWRP